MEMLQKDIWRELEEILNQEELFWYQIASPEWLKFGDRNTKFFHLATVIRKRKNAIVALTNEDGTLMIEPEEIKSITVSYFQNLFSSNNPHT